MPVSPLWEIAANEIQDFDQKVLKDVNPDFAQGQQDVIDLIDSYWVDKYKDGPRDSHGFRKSFYNVILKPSLIASKTIDLDTKDIRVIAEDGQSYFPAWFFGKELNFWMKDAKNKDDKTFGQLLNDIVYNYPKYGHVLLKKAKDTVYLVPLQNITNTQDSRRILESDIVLESHEYTSNQLRNQGFDEAVTERVISRRDDLETITVYEMHGEVGSSDGDNYHILPAEAEEDELLFSSKIKREDLYKELKWDNLPGRALGRGIVESLFENQIAKNENMSLFKMGQRWSAKHIFQTRDEAIAGNLMTQIENGDLIIAQSEINPIAVDDRNLAGYGLSNNQWDKNTADKTFSFEPLSGERPPAGTPLGTSILQSRAAGAFFDLKREELGMFLKEVLFDWIIPGFKKNKKKVHKLMTTEFDEEELEKLRGLILTNKANKSILSFVSRNGRLPSSTEYRLQRALIKEQLKSKREIEIPDGYYDNLKFKIDIVITNEQIDVAARLSTLQTILQIIGSNPALLRDKRTRRIINMSVDLAGFSPLMLGIDDDPDINEAAGQQAPRAGSAPRVAPIAATPAGGNVATQI